VLITVFSLLKGLQGPVVHKLIIASEFSLFLYL